MSDYKISETDVTAINASLANALGKLGLAKAALEIASNRFNESLVEIVPEPTPDTLPTLNYLGQFGVPQTDGVNRDPTHHYGWGGSAFAVSGEAMLLATHDHADWVGELQIPATFPGKAVNVSPAVDMIAPIREATGNGVEVSGLDYRPRQSTLCLSHDRYNVSADRNRVMGLYYPDGSTGGPIGLEINGTRLQSQCYGRGFCRGLADREYYTLGGGLPGQGATGYGPMIHRVLIARDSRLAHDTRAHRVISYMDKTHRVTPEWDLSSRPMAIERIGNWLMVLCTIGFGETWYGDGNDGPGDVVDEWNPYKSYHSDYYKVRALWYRIPDDPAAQWNHTPIVTDPPSPVTMTSAKQGLRMCRDGNLLYILKRNASDQRYDRTPIVYVFEVGA